MGLGRRVYTAYSSVKRILCRAGAAISCASFLVLGRGKSAADPVVLKPFLERLRFWSETDVLTEFHVWDHFRAFLSRTIVYPGLRDAEEFCKIANAPEFHEVFSCSRMRVTSLSLPRIYFGAHGLTRMPGITERPSAP